MNHRSFFLALLTLTALQAAQAQQGWTELFYGSRVEGVLQTGSGALLVGTFDGGIYRSDDDGGSFELVHAFNCTEYFIAFNESSTGQLYALTDYDLLSSFDDGRSWNPCYLRLDLHPGCNPEAITSSGDTVLVSSIDGIWRSPDGFVWDTVSAQHASAIAALGNGIVLGVDGNTTKLLRSTDMGSHWQSLEQSVLCYGALTVGGNGSIFYASQPSWRSRDWGLTWEVVDAFRDLIGRQKIAVNARGTILLSVGGAIYRSRDDGTSWERLQTPGRCGDGVLYIDRQGRAYADYNVLRLIRLDGALTSAAPLAAPAALRCELSPNPAAGAARLSVTLAQPGRLNVSLVDALGRVTALLMDGDMQAGTHTLDLRSESLAPGAYTVLLRAGGETLARRFVRGR